MATKAPAPVPPLDIQFDRASKFYEPGEQVTGTCVLNSANQLPTNFEYQSYTMVAEAYMDTVSAIRGN